MAIKATALITLTRVNDGKGIKSTSVTYQIWSNGTSTPTGTWSSTPPKTTADKPYLWTRTVITYSDNTQSTSYSVGSTPEGIQVGGRNLIDRSDNLKNWAWSSQRGDQYTIDYADDYATINVTTPGTGWQYTFYKLNTRAVLARLKPNTDYTLSFKCEGEINGCNVDIRDGDSSNVITKTAVIKVTNGIASAILHTYDSIKSSNQLIYISGLNKKGMFKLGRPKLELGNKATDWTPAPEDQEQYVDDKIAASEKTTEESYKALINQTAQEISLLVQSVKSTADSNSSSISTIASNLKVTSDGLNATKTSINTLTNAVNGTVSKQELQQYLRWNGGDLELGNSIQPFRCKLSNTELAFYQNEDKVAWISNKELYILKAVIAQSIGCGNFMFVDEGDLGFSLI